MGPTYDVLPDMLWEAVVLTCNLRGAAVVGVEMVLGLEQFLNLLDGGVEV